MQNASMLSPAIRDQLQQIDSALAIDDMQRAMSIAARLADLGVEIPNLLVLAAYYNLEVGKASKALQLATRAQNLAPHNTEAAIALGCCLTACGRTGEAVSIFSHLISAGTATAAVHFNLATAWEQQGELKTARRHYLATLSLSPEDSRAMERLAHLAAKRGDWVEARNYGERSLKRDSGQTFAKLALASADIATGNASAAVDRLREICTSERIEVETRAIALTRLGDALDKLSRFEEAFAAYAEASDALRSLHAPTHGRSPRSAADLARHLLEYFGRDSQTGWRDVASGAFPNPVKTHVFLLGFPRSGTTLLGQILAAHPDVECMEERSCLLDSHHFILEPGGLHKLATMDGDALDGFRAAYWNRVAKEWPHQTKPVFIDKLPLNTILLPLIAKLFPDAKILCAIRDPRDVVFSCFRRRFGMNQQMYELTSLERAATYYDLVMSLCETYRRALSLQFVDIRYEDLVSDFSGRAGKLCADLGLAFSPELSDFAEKSRARHIDTPSAAQVARGLYMDGTNQWLPYRSHLLSVMPALSRWLDRFGYSQDPTN